MGSTKVEAPPPPPAQPTYGESLADAYEAQLKYAQKLYDMEANSKHGRQAYADLDQKVIQRGLLGANGQSGAVGLIGGQDKYRFAGESRARKAGYTSSGQFKGTSGLEQDLINQGRQEELKNITALSRQYGGQLTDSLRSNKMKNLLYTAKNMEKRTGYTKQLTNSDQSILARQEANKVRDVFSRDVTSGGQASDIANSGQATSVSADSVSSPFSARDVTTGGQARDITSSEVGDLGGLRSAMTADALDELNNAGLTDGERRQIEEDARASATARGVARNFGSIVDEVANLDEARRARQAEARQYASQVAGQESQLRSADIANDMQAQLANQQADDAYRARVMQAGSINQQKDMQGSQMALSAQMANQESNLQAQLANQQASNQSLDRSFEASRLNQQAEEAYKTRLAQASQANQQANMQAQLANQSSDQTQMAQILTAGQQDKDNIFRSIASNNQANMQTIQMDRDAIARRIEIEQATSADPFLAITGRQISGTNIGQSSYARGQSTALPQLYNAGQGLEYMSNQQANLANYTSNVYGARVQAQAGKQGALMGALGTIGGSAIKAGMFCWVAREVYGADNPKWILFRHWMLFFSPFWLRAIYLKYGERFANWIEDKPRLKDLIRKWMDSKIIKGA